MEDDVVDPFNDILHSVLCDSRRIYSLMNNWFLHPFSSQIIRSVHDLSLTYTQRSEQSKSTDHNSATKRKKKRKSEKKAVAKDIQLMRSLSMKQCLSNQYSSNYWNPKKRANAENDPLFASFVCEVLYGNCELSVDNDGLYFMKNKCFFVPKTHMNARELEIHGYLFRNSDRFFSRRCYSGYFGMFEGYIHSQRYIHLPQSLSWNILVAFQTFISNQSKNAWIRYWRKDLMVNPLMREERNDVNPFKLPTIDDYLHLQNLQMTCMNHLVLMCQSQYEALYTLSCTKKSLMQILDNSGVRHLLTYLGGTSSDVGVIQGGEGERKLGEMIERDYAVRREMINVMIRHERKKYKSNSAILMKINCPNEIQTEDNTRRMSYVDLTKTDGSVRPVLDDLKPNNINTKSNSEW